MSIRVDQRTLHFERDDEALQEARDGRAAWLDQQLELARLFRRIDAKAAFVPAGCSSVASFASHIGYEGRLARELSQLGYALEAEADLEQLLRDNEIGFAAACAIGRIHRDPELLDPDDEWIQWARFERLADLNRRIDRRVETVRQGRRADIHFSAHVTSRVAANVSRCRTIASRKAGRMLTNGQLLDLFATGYLLQHDALEQDVRTWGKGSGLRRLPPTETRPGDRTIPAEVTRALEERSGGVCEFGSCAHPAREICHLRPHAEGSGREVQDLAQGCHLHHTAYDAGLIRFLGWTSAEDAEGAGLPAFLVVETNDILRPKPRPKQGGGTQPVEELPTWLVRALDERERKRLRRANGSDTKPRPPGPN